VRNPREFKPSEFFASLSRESDRAAAILGLALLDYLLEQVFRRRLHSHTSEDVFAFRGALGDFASRTEMAFALGWLDQDTRDDLSLLRRLRNDFAHDMDHALAFSSSSCRDRLSALRLSRHVLGRVAKVGASLQLDPAGEHALAEVQSKLRAPRGQFELAITVLAGTIVACYYDPAIDPSGAKGVLPFVDPVMDSVSELLESTLVRQKSIE
jgi:DNA-binding MltR family transcriptional regulator